MRAGLFGAMLRDSNAASGELPWGLFSSVSATGVQINQATALQVTTVMACTSVLAEDVSKMTPRIWRTVPLLGHPNGSRIALTSSQHPVAALLRHPNDWQTWPEFCQCMMVGLVLRGNAYAVIVRDFRGVPKMLVPINPDRCRLWESPDGSLFWMVTKAGLHEMAVLRNTPMLVPYEDMLHVKGLSANGLIGLSRIAVNREAVALAIAQEQQYARLMGNGARPAGVLSTDQKLTPEAAARLRNDWDTLNAGLLNSGRTAVLEMGLKWEAITLTSVDLQFLQLRGFQVQEICRMFRVPPHMVGDLTRGTFASITQQSQDYRNNTLMTYTLLWEERFAFTFDLDDEGLYMEMDPTALLKADLTTRYNAYRVGILTGFNTPNEVRVAEGLDVKENGDVLLSPTNMAPLGTLPTDNANPDGSKPGSDMTGRPEPGAGKPSEKVGVDDQPIDPAASD